MEIVHPCHQVLYLPTGQRAQRVVDLSQHKCLLSKEGHDVGPGERTLGRLIDKAGDGRRVCRFAFADGDSRGRSGPGCGRHLGGGFGLFRPLFLRAGDELVPRALHLRPRFLKRACVLNNNRGFGQLLGLRRLGGDSQARLFDGHSSLLHQPRHL